MIGKKVKFKVSNSYDYHYLTGIVVDKYLGEEKVSNEIYGGSMRIAVQHVVIEYYLVSCNGEAYAIKPSQVLSVID